MFAWIDWRAALLATVAGALTAVATLSLFASWQAGRLDGEEIFFIIVVALPVALLVAAPIGFILLPGVRALLAEAGALTRGRMLLAGLVIGLVLPLVVAFVFRIRFVTETFALAGIYAVAAALGGLVGALVLELATRRRSS